MGARRIVKKSSAKKSGAKKTTISAVDGWLTRRLLGGVLVIGALGGLLGFTIWQLSQADTLPIQQVQVKGEFRYLDKQSLYKKVASLTSAGFFNVDVGAVKQAAEAMPWV